MQNYKLRLIIEKAELEIKINDLFSFIDSSPIFDELSEYGKELLQLQHEAMEGYRDALSARLLSKEVKG